MAEGTPPMDCEIFDCPICFEKYRTPRTLPCLHTFCEECLDIYIKAQVKNESQFSCPVCRAFVTIPESKAKVEKLAALFPVNHMIVSIMDSAIKTLDVTTLCDPCKKDSEDTLAEFWCESCSQAQCKLCNKVHNRLPSTMSHNSIPITEARMSRKSGKLVQHVDENCPLHDGKTLEVYCSDHSQLCCVVCFATKHRECKHISDIDSKSKETEDSLFLKFISDLATATANMDKIVREKGENLTKIDSEKETIIREMESTVDQAKQHLDKLLSIFKDEVYSAHDRGHSSLLTNQKEIQSFIKNADNAQKLLQTIISNDSQRQKFITYEKLRSQVLSHFENLMQIFKGDQELSLVHQMDNVLKQCIHKMTSLGVVDTKQKTSTTSGSVLSSVSEILYSDDQSSAQVPVMDFLSASVSLVKEVKPSDLGGSVWFTGGTFLNNGNLLLVDGPSETLKEYNLENWKMVKEYKVSGDPACISLTDAGNILISFCHKREICCYELKSPLKLLYKISTPRQPCGVAACGDNVVVTGKGFVDILSRKGEVIRSTTLNCNIGDDVYVAASKNLKTIYHRNGDTVVCSDPQGGEVFTYRNTKLSVPSGIGLDTYDNLYVVGFRSCNLHQISADGQRSRILVEKFNSIKRPWCVVVHPSKNIVVVTSLHETTALEVYRLNE